jgi:hypothetical protein
MVDGAKTSTWPEFRLAPDGSEENQEIALTIGRLLEVDVGVAQRAARDDITADADREDWADSGELLKEHRFGDVRMQIPDIK